MKTNNEIKGYKGKAIYNPRGKAGEYCYWACNIYNGCSNNCSYCYCKKGFMGRTWSVVPYLKKCFKNEEDAIKVFIKEVLLNLDALKEHGLFFEFTSDPFLKNTHVLIEKCVKFCMHCDIPVKILTKNNPIKYCDIARWDTDNNKRLLSFGFTLTGHDELEPGANTNIERIEAMHKLHDLGFLTFASIEPIIDFESSLKMIRETLDFCDLYLIGLQSGKKYDKGDLISFVYNIEFPSDFSNTKYYFKDSLLNKAGINREDLPKNCVGRDYKLHETKSSKYNSALPSFNEMSEFIKTNITK